MRELLNDWLIGTRKRENNWYKLWELMTGVDAWQISSAFNEGRGCDVVKGESGLLLDERNPKFSIQRTGLMGGIIGFRLKTVILRNSMWNFFFYTIKDFIERLAAGAWGDIYGHINIIVNHIFPHKASHQLHANMKLHKKIKELRIVVNAHPEKE